ncbi:MAG: PilZ domain-containing protein, partial [Candidatus Omnitrophota bacterium]
GGIAFHSTETLHIGDILEMKVLLDDGHPPIECIGKVLRVNHVYKISAGQSKACEAGVCFLAIHSNDRQRIENYCRVKAAS